MTEWIRTWLLTVAGAAMVLALAECICPEGSVKRICRLAGGLVLILTVIQPLVKLDFGDLDTWGDKYRTEAGQNQKKLEETRENLYETLIGEKTIAYISDKTEELGMDCQVQVSVTAQGDILCPSSVTVSGTWTEEQRRQLSTLLETELGIPPSQQKFEERTP